jgi:hypothetical protein
MAVIGKTARVSKVGELKVCVCLCGKMSDSRGEIARFEAGGAEELQSKVNQSQHSAAQSTIEPGLTSKHPPSDIVQPEWGSLQLFYACM